MSEWIEWKGGKCPATPGDGVEWRTLSGESKGPIYYHDGDLDWDRLNDPTDIVAYRISKANGDKDE